MASINNKCFKKKCLCAVCTKLCSRCFVQDEQCKDGTEMCTCFKKLEYKDYIHENPHSKITEEEYNTLLSEVSL